MATATATAVATTMITTPPSMEPNNLITKSEERENLRNIIAQWNANRLDLFEISEPNEDLEFYGVMRFYFQDAGQKVATKCMRISSTASTADVINNLIEKFRPDIRMLSVPEYALYEIHENGEERKLADVEFPLLVQLNWHKDDREGRFLLRRMDEKTYLPGFTSDSGNIFNRKLSKREKKEKKKKEKKEKASASSLANNGMANSNNCNSNGGGGGGGGRKDSMKMAKDSLAEKLYTELPETSFTRSISNPEAVMRRRRQQKLEKKLQQFSQEGGADAGGTLRIFGESINQDVPYKTILLSTRDTASFAVKEILEKYGKDKEDPQQYCLVQVIVPYVNGDSGNPNGVHQQDANSGSTGNPGQQQQQPATASQNDSNSTTTTNNNNNSGIREYILDDDDCPLIIERSHNKSRGVLTFHIRRRPPDYQPRRRKKKLGEQQQHQQQQQQPPQHPQPQQSSSQLNSPTSTSSLNPSYETTFDADGKVETSSTMGTIGAIKSENNVVVGQPPTQQSSSMMFNTGSLQRHQTMGSLARSSTSTLGSQMPTNTLMDQNMSRGIGGPPAPTSSSQMINHHPAQMIRKGDNILPAILEVGEEVEDLFLTTIIKRIDPNQVQFKLCITYSLYMVTRYRASTYFKPEITPEIRAELLIMFCIKYSKMIQQTITEHQKDQSSLAFWLANSSEILHFLKNDRHLSAFTFDSQDILAEAVQMAFKYLVTFQQNDLQEALSTFSQDIVDQTNGAMDKMTQNILKVLSNSMQLLRRFRVNAALTIQLFSQLFHFINMWLFNKVIGTPETNYCSMMFGMKLKQCLAQIELWAEKQGLELAAECHLSRIKQTAMFLQATKKSQDDLNSLVANFYKLNSIQLRALCERYQPMPDELSFTADNIQNMVRMARKTTDELILNDGREIRLEEESDLQLPFLLPEDGYSCDIVRSIPTGLQGFVQTLVQTGVCSLTIQPTASGYWTIYFINFQPDQQQQQLQQPPSNTIIPSHTSSTTSRMYQEYSENMKNSQRNSVTTNLSISDKNSISNVHHFASNNNTNNQQMNQQHHSLPKSLTQTMLTGKQQPQQQPGPPPPSSSTTMLPGQMMTLGLNSAAYGTVRMMAEPEIQVIKLQKINNGIGLSIVAARGTNQSQLGIYIKSVVKGGAADMDGRLEAGDQLLKVDGQSLIGITQEKAAELMTQTGPVVTLEVAKQGALYHGLGGILSQQASASAAGSASMIAKNMTLRPRMVVPNANDYGSSMHHRFNSQYSPMLSPQHHPQAARVPGYNSLPLSLNYPYRNQMGQTIGPIGAGGGGGGGPQQLPSMNYGAAAGAVGGNSVINNPNMRPESQLSYNSQTANNNHNNMSPSLVNNTTITNNSNNNNNIVNGRHMNLSTASLPAVNQNHSPAAAHIFGNHAPMPSSHQHLHQHPHPHHPHHNLAGGPEERHYQNIQLYHINPTSSSIHNPNPSGGNQISSQQQQQQQQSSSVSNMMPRSRLSASQQPQQTSSSSAAALANGFRPSSYHGSSSIINSMIRNSNFGLGNIGQTNVNGPPPPAPKPNRSMVLGQSGGGVGPVSGQENMIQHNNHNHQNHNNSNNNMNPYQHQQPHPPQPQQPPPPAVNYRYGPKGSISSPLTTTTTTPSTTGTDLKSTKKVSWDDNPASVLNHHGDSDNSEEIEDDEDDEDEGGEEEANNNANGRREQEAVELEGEEEEEEEEDEDGEGEGKDGVGGGGGDEEAQEDRFSLQDIDDVLGSHGSNGEDWLNNYVSGSTPGVIGAQEVYNDPRKRIEAERFKSSRNQTNQDKLPEKLSFQEKMKMFAKKTSGGV